MNNLLNEIENRRLKHLEILSNTNGWIAVDELSKKLNVPIRVIKEDILYFRKKFSEFTIEHSNEKVKIVYQQNKGLKNVYQCFLSESSAYQLLEAAFLHDGKSIFELEDLLFLGNSTIYRLIHKINNVISAYNFSIQTNPVSIVGDENNIRSFFYRYYLEKYCFSYFPFSTLNEKTLDKFLNFHIQLTQLNHDFAYYNKFKIITAVNLIRFQNGHFVDTKDIELNYESAVPNLDEFADLFKEFEQVFNIKYDEFAIKQIFTSYVQDKFSLNYDHLIDRVAEDKEIAAEVAFITQTFDRLSKEHDIPIPNRKKLISAFRNVIHLDYLEPNPGYILYDRNKYFTKEIQANYPNFYRSLYKAMKELRQFLNKPPTEEGINFYIYTVFTYWRGLFPELLKKSPKIRVIVISDRHYTHARMLKEFISFEFSEQTEIDIYEDINLNRRILENLEYDLIVTNFLIPELNNKRTLYIRNVPKHRDLKKLQENFQSIMEEREKYSLAQKEG